MRLNGENCGNLVFLISDCAFSRSLPTCNFLVWYRQNKMLLDTGKTKMMLKQVRKQLRLDTSLPSLSYE